jgi:hypothetical protein
MEFDKLFAGLEICAELSLGTPPAASPSRPTRRILNIVPGGLIKQIAKEESNAQRQSNSE